MSLSFSKIAALPIILIAAVAALQGCAVAAIPVAGTCVAMATDRRTTGTIVDDKSIEVKVAHAIAQDRDLWKKSHISAVSYNNVLLLVGQAPNEEMRRRAELAASDIPKVRRIHNEISVAEPAPIDIRSQDSWITTQIKSKMVGTKGFNATRVKVVTEDGIVYLMGLTTPEEQMIATDIARAVDGVEKVVQIFEQCET